MQCPRQEPWILPPVSRHRGCIVCIRALGSDLSDLRRSRLLRSAISENRAALKLRALTARGSSRDPLQLSFLFLQHFLTARELLLHPLTTSGVNLFWERSTGSTPCPSWSWCSNCALCTAWGAINWLLVQASLGGNKSQGTLQP